MKYCKRIKDDQGQSWVQYKKKVPVCSKYHKYRTYNEDCPMNYASYYHIVFRIYELPIVKKWVKECIYVDEIVNCVCTDNPPWHAKRAPHIHMLVGCFEKIPFKNRLRKLKAPKLEAQTFQELKNEKHVIAVFNYICSPVHCKSYHKAKYIEGTVKPKKYEESDHVAIVYFHESINEYL